MFFNGMQIYEYVIQIDMDELTDTVAKDGGHQLLEGRGCCNHLSASLGSWMCQGQLQMLSYGYVLAWCVFVHMLQTYWASIDMPPWPYHCKWYLGQGRESCSWLYYCSVLVDWKQYVVYCFFWYAEHWHHLMCHCRYPPLSCGVSLKFLREFFVEMFWAFQQLVVDMFLGINQIDLMVYFPDKQEF